MHKLTTDTSDQFRFTWNGADYFTPEPFKLPYFNEVFIGQATNSGRIDLSTEGNTCQTIEVTTVDV